MKEQVELASEFDKLVTLPGWEKVLRFAGEQVNAALVEATAHKYDRERLSLGVLEWNFKRALLDDVLGHIESVRAERDRIVAEFRREETDGGSGNGAVGN